MEIPAARVKRHFSGQAPPATGPLPERQEIAASRNKLRHAA
jgi:hypothetical protein